MSKICPECGCVNENDNARFCNDCGAKFEVVIPEPKAEERSSLDKPKKIVLTRADGNVNKPATSPVRIQKVETETREEVVSEPEPVAIQEEAPVQKKPQQTLIVNQIDDDDEEPAVVEPIVAESIEDDDFDDYDAKPVQAKTPVVQNDDYIDEDPDFEIPDEDSFVAIDQNDAHTEEDVKQLITNDKYYDDILPEIDNEIKAIPKDIIFKGIGIVAVVFVIAFYLISIW